MSNEFLTTVEAAAFLKRSIGSIYNLVFAGKLRCYKPGGKSLLFRKDELVAWIERGVILSDDEIAERAAKRS